MTHIRIKIVGEDGPRTGTARWLRSVVLFVAGMVSLFIPRLIADSAPMQWAGFFIFLAGLFFVCVGVVVIQCTDYLTIEEARKKLEELS